MITLQDTTSIKVLTQTERTDLRMLPNIKLHEPVICGECEAYHAERDKKRSVAP